MGRKVSDQHNKNVTFKTFFHEGIASFGTADIFLPIQDGFCRDCPLYGLGGFAKQLKFLSL
jgi:hypothetical protein